MLRQPVTRFMLLLTSLLLLIAISITATAQAPSFRIGVFGEQSSPLAQGARLAVEQINSAGGVIGAEGSRFSLELLFADEDEETADIIQRFAGESLAAIIGPSSSTDVLSNLNDLQLLGIPVFTLATDDSIIALDTTSNLFRIVSQDVVQTRGLASYAVNDAGLFAISTVQLDIESTGKVFGFSEALTTLGRAPVSGYVLDTETTLEDIVDSITTLQPTGVAVFGDAQTAADLLVQLRTESYFGTYIYANAEDESFRELVPTDALAGVLGVSTWSYTLDDENSLNFINAYLRAFGEVPTAASAASYDAIFLFREAFGRPGEIQTNLRDIANYQGAQGIISPASFASGESSNNVVVQELGPFGAPVAVARYIGNEVITAGVGQSTSSLPTPAPLPSATPDGVFVTITRTIQNIRSGPSLDYDVIGQANQGETYDVIGTNIEETWVAISYRGIDGWLSLGILDIAGNTDTIPLLQAPPLPTPIPAPIIIGGSGGGSGSSGGGNVAPPPSGTASAQADVVIVSASPARLTLNQNNNVTVVTRNQGSVASGGFAVAGTFKPGDVYSGVEVGAINPGQSETLALNVNVNGATGPYNIVIVADLNNNVPEDTNGEANNDDFIYQYIADAPLLSNGGSGTLTVNNGAGINLDGGSGDDISWNNGTLTGNNATRFAIANTFTSFDATHRDGLPNPDQTQLSGANIQPGTLIAFRTDGDNRLGVMEIISSPNGGSLQFRFRIYQ